MNISGTALPPRRLRREADSASATYTVNPRYSRALCSQVRLLARSIRNPQINARSCSRPFTDTCRAAIIRVAPHALNGGRSRHVPAPVSAPTAFAGAPSQSSCCHSCTFFVLFCWYKMRPPPQGSAEVLSGVPRRRKAGMCLVRKMDVR